MNRPYGFVRNLSFKCHPERRRACEPQSKFCDAGAKPRSEATMGSPNGFPYFPMRSNAERAASIPYLIVGAIHESSVLKMIESVWAGAGEQP